MADFDGIGREVGGGVVLHPDIWFHWRLQSFILMRMTIDSIACGSEGTF
jgi:hypothetical protein